MGTERHLSVRLSDHLLKKFRYVCEYNGRSANKQKCIRKTIRDYEKEHGPIDLDKSVDEEIWVQLHIKIKDS